MRGLACWLVLIVSAAGYANAVEIQRWERIPLALPLIVGQERIVFVDQNVRVGVPRSLLGKLRVQSTGGTLYLLASEAIDPTRLQLQNMATGEIMLVDIAARAGMKDEKAPEPIRIVAGDRHNNRYGQVSSQKQEHGLARSRPDLDEFSEAPAAGVRETPVPVVLTRYAAQVLYAPLRTLEPIAGVTQVNLNRWLDLTTLMPTLPVEAKALGAWRMSGYWVTAVKLKNTHGEHLTLDPRDLMGDFVAATFQHPYLGIKGTPTDTTVAYLVTRGHGLAESLLPSRVAQIDPKGGIREK